MYFSEWSGERNSVSAALSKPSPPRPSAGSRELMFDLEVEKIAHGVRRTRHDSSAE
jgi:hypothetical protein